MAELVKVEQEQLNELLRQNKEMKEDIFLLLASVNYFAGFLPKGIEKEKEMPSMAALMLKMAPMVKNFMAQVNSPQMMFTINNLKTIHDKYGNQIQQPVKQIENTGANQPNWPTDGELPKQ